MLEIHACVSCMLLSAEAHTSCRRRIPLPMLPACSLSLEDIKLACMGRGDGRGVLQALAGPPDRAQGLLSDGDVLVVNACTLGEGPEAWQLEEACLMQALRWRFEQALTALVCGPAPSHQPCGCHTFHRCCLKHMARTYGACWGCGVADLCAHK